jgi:phospholipase/carboxylesterase
MPGSPTGDRPTVRHIAALDPGLVLDLAGRGRAGRSPGDPLGFSGGAAFVGGLVLHRPQRFAGAGIRYSMMPFDAGLPVEPGRLAGLPVFVAQGDQDAVILAELLRRTWSYLTDGSGADAEAVRLPGGHGISPEALQRLVAWLTARVER